MHPKMKRVVTLGLIAAAGCGIIAASFNGVATTGASAPAPKEDPRITELQAVLVDNPRDSLTAIRLATVLADNNRYEEAAQWLDLASKLDPSRHEEFVRAVAGSADASLDEIVAASPRGSGGADVVLSNILSVSNYSPVGSVHAYALGSHTCNIGDQPLAWDNNGTPAFGMNAYRLHDGRLMQVGMSFAKTACCVFNQNGCGLACSGTGFGLRAGCLDIYSATWNGNQARLGPRSVINAFTGEFQPLPSGSGDSTFRRLQIDAADLDTSTYPGALYFVEGVYVCTDSSLAGNTANNATYKRVTFNASNNMALAPEMSAGRGAIWAWADHGEGLNALDRDIDIRNVDVPDEGRFVFASKVIDNGDGSWRYEYAVFNLNSDRSGGSFSVPVPDSVTVTNVGFHSPPYHSGEIYDNTFWTSSVGSGAVTWSSPETYAQNPNTNALRWGTMYNFWFEADTAPESANVTLGLFKPGAPGSINAGSIAPSAIDCPWDLSGDGQVGSADLGVLLGQWGTTYGASDLAELLGSWGPCN
ncbi:MAG: hypothetical protein EA376_01565 [Phycisphaeraceae bacterium]|nr:MAG: hypothetical protein EA376_01565 [Phycisphaeraceae bacterium]